MSTRPPTPCNGSPLPERSQVRAPSCVTRKVPSHSATGTLPVIDRELDGSIAEFARIEAALGRNNADIAAELFGSLGTVCRACKTRSALGSGSKDAGSNPGEPIPEPGDRVPRSGFPVELAANSLDHIDDPRVFHRGSRICERKALVARQRRVACLASPRLER